MNSLPVNSVSVPGNAAAQTANAAVANNEPPGAATPPAPPAAAGQPERTDRTRLVELAILLLTLTVTSALSTMTYFEMRRQTEVNHSTFQQTKQHFAIQRTTSAIERFNSESMIKSRHVVDQWLGSGQSAAELLDWVSIPPYHKQDIEKDVPAAEAKERTAKADEVFLCVRTMINFLQELGTAFVNDTVDEKYTWDVFGGLVKRYGTSLQPYREEVRRRLGRKEVLQDVDALVARMHELDKKYAK